MTTINTTSQNARTPVLLIALLALIAAGISVSGRGEKDTSENRSAERSIGIQSSSSVAIQVEETVESLEHDWFEEEAKEVMVDFFIYAIAAPFEVRLTPLYGLTLQSKLGWGWVIPIFEIWPFKVKPRQLIFEAEDLRHVPEIWERAWNMEMPDEATPYRVHGGVI
ncbi:MAG: hypothetical protein Tsb009_03190 [Planctomycetaceae bacterium]